MTVWTDSSENIKIQKEYIHISIVYKIAHTFHSDFEPMLKTLHHFRLANKSERKTKLIGECVWYE